MNEQQNQTQIKQTIQTNKTNTGIVKHTKKNRKKQNRKQTTETNKYQTTL